MTIDGNRSEGMAKKRAVKSKGNGGAKVAGMSSEAVKAKTGKTWDEWIRALDKAGATKLDHKGIVAIVGSEHGIGPWWQQMVTVGYEQARGLREKHETTSGYSVSRSKTLNVGVGSVFKAWKNERARAQWLDDSITIRKATVNKSMRITWTDGTSNVEVNFYPKGVGKTQLAVQHNKLPNAKAAAKMKAFWGQRLQRLQETIQVQPS